jgi:transcriptional regulator with XRE-family HTH domain
MANTASSTSEAFGEYLRAQRKLAQLSLRQLAELTNISNPYLSQIERGVHQPSVRVIRSLADALNLSAQALLAQAAGIDLANDDDRCTATEDAIRDDPRLTTDQKSALLMVLRGFVGAEGGGGTESVDRSDGTGRA